MKASLDKVLEVILLFLLGVVLLNVIWQVVSRYLFESPSTLTDEISRFGLIWIGLLGSAYAHGKGLHLAIDILGQSLVKHKREVLLKVIEVIVFFFCLSVLVFGGIKLCVLSYSLGQVSSTLGIALAFVYVVVPLAGLCMCYYSVHRIFNLR